MSSFYIEFRDPLFSIIILLAIIFVVSFFSYWWGRYKIKEDHKYLDNFLKQFHTLPSQKEIVDLVKKHCNNNIENLISKREEKTKELISELKSDVEKNDYLGEDEKTAWLGNIDIMTPYYMQFIENELVYECLLNVLADDIYARKIQEIKFNLGKNYGFVFSYLQNVLNEHTPPVDTDVKVDIFNGKTVGRFLVKFPKKLDL